MVIYWKDNYLSRQSEQSLAKTSPAALHVRVLVPLDYILFYELFQQRRSVDAGQHL